jgi:ABC-type lipoprotein release transport system permease subunit
LLTSLLYGVSPDDFATLATVCGLLLAVAGAASVLPARATVSIDPVQALRAE